MSDRSGADKRASVALPESADASGRTGEAGAERPSDKLTHAELVERAARWLRNTRKCGVVLAERACGGSSEIPDAIGWAKSFWSLLVECKASRADFLKDKKKHFRRDDGGGMGQRRVFFTNPGVIWAANELPEGWGWAVVDGARVRVVVEPPERGYDYAAARHELALLYSFARRAQLGIEPTVGCLVPKAGADEEPVEGLQDEPKEAPRG